VIAITADKLRQIRVHIRFLKRACNGGSVHPFDRQELWEWREALARLTIRELKANRLNYHEVAETIMELEMLLRKGTEGLI